LCEDAGGAITPLLVQAVEDGIDDSVHALHVDETDHGPSATTDLHEATPDDVGGAQLPPHIAQETEEVKQFRQVLLQASHQARINTPPFPLQVQKGALRLGETRDYGNSAAKPTTGHAQRGSVREPGERQKKTFLTQLTSLEM